MVLNHFSCRLYYVQVLDSSIAYSITFLCGSEVLECSVAHSDSDTMPGYVEHRVVLPYNSVDPDDTPIIIRLSYSNGLCQDSEQLNTTSELQNF